MRDYEVIAPLTEGGMATLMLARRRGVGGFSRLVALKLVHQRLTQDSTMIRLFLDEARISAHVTHPNVVHVEEVGVHDGMYFIAMEYVHGVSLAHLLQRLSQDRRRMSPTLAVCLAAQVAEALHAAHEAVGEDGTPLHVVHRDVSPQNVLLAHTGHVKLIDFGIAKSKAALHETRSGAGLLGKLRYMSPEQLNSEGVDARSDLYALAVVLWEMLTARNFLRCHRMEDPRDLATRENPPPPSRYSSLVKPLLDRVLLRALAPDPNHRYASALDFRRAMLKAQPDAARIDAVKLATMLRAVVGDELDAQAARLPQEVTHALVDTVLPRPPEAKASLSELTMQLSAQDMDGSGDLTPERGGPLDAYGRDTTRTGAPHPAGSLSRDSETLRPPRLSANMAGPMLLVACLSTALGVWIGRATAPQPEVADPQAGLETGRSPVVAAAGPAPVEGLDARNPLTAPPRPDGAEAHRRVAVTEDDAAVVDGPDKAAVEPRNPGVKPRKAKRLAPLRKRVVPKPAKPARPRNAR